MITLISFEDIERIGKKLGYGIANKGAVEFLISKIKSTKPSDNPKRDIAKIAAYIWHGIIASHPLLDGNKRTATEAMRLFLVLNNADLDIPPNGLIYTSLKIANGDMALNQLMEFIYERIGVEA